MFNSFTFKGRVTRQQYFIVMLLTNLAEFISVYIIQKSNIVGVTVFLVLINIAICAKYICMTVQRLHDLNRPGTHYWLLFIPIYNVYLNLLLVFKAGIESTGVSVEDTRVSEV